MIKIPVVGNCPYTHAGEGVMHIAHPVLAVLAGAVHDKDEWMAFLIGTRSENGLEVRVTELRIPDQRRGHGFCETVKQEPLAPDVVGVVHSHHTMGAFFSNTDDTKLNPRFPTSIVVAQPKYQTNNEGKLLGFAYKAEGRVPLPCGSIGIVDFTALPDPMVDEWPISAEPKFHKPQLDKTLYYCPHTKVEAKGINQSTTTKCGITKVEATAAVFGRNGDKFIKEVEKKTEASQHGGQWNYYEGTGKPYVVNDKRYKEVRGFQPPPGGRGPWDTEDELYMRSWSEYWREW